MGKQCLQDWKSSPILPDAGPWHASTLGQARDLGHSAAQTARLGRPLAIRWASFTNLNDFGRWFEGLRVTFVARGSLRVPNVHPKNTSRHEKADFRIDPFVGLRAAEPGAAGPVRQGQDPRGPQR